MASKTRKFVTSFQPICCSLSTRDRHPRGIIIRMRGAGSHYYIYLRMCCVVGTCDIPSSLFFSFQSSEIRSWSLRLYLTGSTPKKEAVPTFSALALMRGFIGPHNRQLRQRDSYVYSIFCWNSYSLLSKSLEYLLNSSYTFFSKGILISSRIRINIIVDIKF